MEIIEQVDTARRQAESHSRATGGILIVVTSGFIAQRENGRDRERDIADRIFRAMRERAGV